jgi:hypothetical protein
MTWTVAPMATLQLRVVHSGPNDLLGSLPAAALLSYLPHVLAPNSLTSNASWPQFLVSRRCRLVPGLAHSPQVQGSGRGRPPVTQDLTWFERRLNKGEIDSPSHSSSAAPCRIGIASPLWSQIALSSNKWIRHSP